MILIDAMFINKGGGSVLLEYLIETILIQPEHGDFFFLLDPRFKIPESLKKNYIVIPNKITERIKYYKNNHLKFKKVFCFANTPPPIKLKIPTYTYFHNQKLLEAPKRKFNRAFHKLYLKYLITKLYNKNTDYYIVQTPHMVSEMLSIKLKRIDAILTIPFYDDTKYRNEKPFVERKKNEFVFISNPSPQKNYPNLLNAWEYLLEKGYKPVLHVTIDDTAPQFIERVKELNSKGANIINHVYVNPKELYYACQYLLFPSIMESFGLPLIEAASSGMKILASDLPYVYDAVKPSITFNPFDKIAIADTVIKSMTEELPEPEIVTKNEINKLISLLVN